MRIRQKIFSGIKLLSVLLLLAGTIWVVTFVYEIRDLSSYLNDPSGFLNQQVLLEEGSTINPNDLHRLLAFSSEHPTVDISETESILLKDVQIASFLSNSCREDNCFQFKVKFSEIPSHLWRNLIAIEDKRFLSHFGLDYKSLFRAVLVNLKELTVKQGGSTITQQLVKNLYLTNKKSLLRKIKEALIATYIEINYEKEQILEGYFNEIYWGHMEGLKIKGVYAASIFYFQKKPQDLDVYESSILISLLKGPYYYSPTRFPERLKARVKYHLEKNSNLISENEKKIFWSEQKWSHWINDLKKNTVSKANACFIYELAKENESIDFYDRYVLCKRVWEKVHELNVNRTITNSFDAKVQIRNRITNKDFYFSTIQYDEERGKEEIHMLGSTIKPLIVGILARKNLNWDQKIETAGVKLKLKSGLWIPKESHKILEEKLSVKEILEKSLNSPIIRMVQTYGFDEMEEELKKIFPGLKVPLSEYPAQLLGSIEVPFGQTLNIYNDFINEQCLKPDENPLFEALTDHSQTTIRKQVTKEMVSLKFFGKTGTTNNGHDNWFMFHFGKYVGTIWVGLRSGLEKNDTGTYGSTTAFQIFQNWILGRGKRFEDCCCAAQSN